MDLSVYHFAQIKIRSTFPDVCKIHSYNWYRYKDRKNAGDVLSNNPENSETAQFRFLFHGRTDPQQTRRVRQDRKDESPAAIDRCH